MFHFCFAVAKTSSRIHLVKTVQTGYVGGLPSKAQKVRTGTQNGINIETTTKVEKKGVLAYQEAPQRKISWAQLRQQERDRLQLKSTNPLQETEKCSWPKINLTFPPSHRNPAACNNLDFRTQGKYAFISCKDLDHWWTSLRGSLCLLDYCTFLASGRKMGVERKLASVCAALQHCGRQLSFRAAPWQGRCPKSWNDIQVGITQTFVVWRLLVATEMIYVSFSCSPRAPGTYYRRWHIRVFLKRKLFFFPLAAGKILVCSHNLSFLTPFLPSPPQTCLFQFSHQWNMLPVRLGDEIKKNSSNKQQDLLPLYPQGFTRAVTKVTRLLFGPRICGWGSQEGEILISQKYVKGRRKRGTRKKKRLLAESMSTKGGMLRWLTTPLSEEQTRSASSIETDEANFTQ